MIEPFGSMYETSVRRENAAPSSGCKSHPVTAPARSSRSSYGGDEIADAFGKRVTVRAICAYQKCGLKIEGRERGSAFVNGIWHDDLMMAILDHEYAEIQHGKA
jgi:hypothetical protein